MTHLHTIFKIPSEIINPLKLGFQYLFIYSEKIEIKSYSALSVVIPFAVTIYNIFTCFGIYM